MFEPMGAGVHGVEAAEVAGKTVLVSGCGPIGLTAISASKTFGAAKVIACDLIDEKLEVAKKMGADAVLNSAKCDLPAEVRTLTGGVGVDAAIVSDPAAVLLAREQAPGLPLHLSTQANTLNSRAAAFWHGQGVERVILARELTMEDLRAIRANTPKTLALEAFVHGAVCASYSGRCVLSNYLTGRDANQGACAQTCRWKYALVEEKRPGEYLPIVEDGRGTYLYSANDLCMIEHLAELLEAGVSSFKIEGRMKTDYYVATVVSAYRRALDDALAGKPFDPELLRRACFASHRPYGTGFYFTRRPDSPPGSVQVQQGASYLAKVLETYPDGRGLVEQRNKFLAGERLQLFGPGGYADFLAEDLRSPEGEPLSAAPHPKQRLTLPLPPQAQAGDYLVRIKEQA